MSDLPRDLRIKAGMIMMCERIPFGSDATLMELAANEIEQLKQRNAELESMLVEVNNNRTGVSPCARFCEALAAKKMFDNLQRERDELAAQIELINKAWLCPYPECIMDELNEVINKTPAQCLSEHDREVAARAVEQAADYAAGLISDKYGIATSGTMLEILDHKTDVVLCVAEYANKIRQGNVEL